MWKQLLIFINGSTSIWFRIRLCASTRCALILHGKVLLKSFCKPKTNNSFDNDYPGPQKCFYCHIFTFFLGFFIVVMAHCYCTMRNIIRIECLGCCGFYSNGNDEKDPIRLEVMILIVDRFLLAQFAQNIHMRHIKYKIIRHE